LCLQIVLPREFGKLLEQLPELFRNALLILEFINSKKGLVGAERDLASHWLVMRRM